MTKRSMLLIIVLAMGVITLAVAGCGSGSTTTTAAVTPGAPTSAPDTTVATEATGEPIRIGVVTSLTGPLAATGTQVATGVKYAAQEWNDKGGVNGRQVEVLVEDDQSTPNGSVNAFNALLSKNPNFIVGPTFTPLIMPLAPILEEQAKIPFFTSATGTPITKAGGGWFFRLRTNDTQTALLLIQYGIEELKAQKPAIIYPNNDYGKSGLTVMSEYLASTNLKFVAQETFNQGTDKDVSAQLNKIKNSGADLLIGWTVPVDSGMISVQATQIGMGMPILGSPGFGTPEFLKLAQGSTEGIKAIIDSTAGQDDASKDWAGKVKAAFPDSPVSFVVSAAYDGTSMALAEIGKGADTGDALRDALAAIKDYQGITGTYSFDAEHNGLHQGVIIEWKGQKFTPIKTIVQNP